MLRLLLALSSLVILSISANHHHDQRGYQVHVPPPPPHHPPNHHNGRWRRGLAAAGDNSDEETQQEDAEVPADWRRPRKHEFLSGLSEDAKRAFFAIKMNEDLSRNEMREKILDWAEENGLEDEVSAHFTQRDAEIKARKEAMAAAIEELPEAYEKILPLFEDASLTRRERMSKIEDAQREYSEELKSLLRAALPCGGGRHHNDRSYRKWRGAHSRGSDGPRLRHGSRRAIAEEAEDVEF